MGKALLKLTLTLIGVCLTAITVAVSGFHYLKPRFYIDPMSENGVMLNSVLLLFIIGSIPLSLAFFNRMTKKWAVAENKDSRIQSYTRGGIVRILVIGLALNTGIIFYYIMNSQSMLYSAGMAAVALVFCIPTRAKILTELCLEDEQL